MNQDNRKLKEQIQRWEDYSLFAFIPIAAIAIFSDNILFETVGLICGIAFATLIFVEKKL